MNKMNKTLLGIMLVAIIVVVTIGTSFSYMTSGLDGSVQLDVIDVKDGKMIATIAQKPTEIGETAIETAVKSLNGEKVEKDIPIELELIKK